MGYSVEISGIDSIMKMLEPSRVNQASDRILDRATQAWRDDIKKLPPVSAKTTGYGAQGIPVDTGLMRQMVQARRLSDIAAEVYAGVQYSSYVVEGARGVPPRDFFKYGLDFGGMSDIERIVLEELTRLVNA